jgi:hypothetical protein
MRTLLFFLAILPAFSQPQTLSDNSFTTPYTISRIGPSDFPAQSRLTPAAIRDFNGTTIDPFGVITIQLNAPNTSPGGYGYYYDNPTPITEGSAWFFFTQPNWRVSLGGGPPFTRITYRESFQFINYSCRSCTDDIVSYPAIRQGNAIFVGPALRWLRNTNNWQRQGLDNLNPNDFREFNRPGANRINLSPNAPPLEFGIVRGFVANETTELQTGIDSVAFILSRPTTLSTTPDTYLVYQSTGTQTIPESEGLLSNDSVRTGFRATVHSQPRGGLVLRNNGSFDYTPAPGLTSDSFEYIISSPDAQSNPTPVNIRILPPRLACTLTYQSYSGNYRLDVSLDGAPVLGALPVTVSWFAEGVRNNSFSERVILGSRSEIFRPQSPIGNLSVSISLGSQRDVCRQDYFIAPSTIPVIQENEVSLCMFVGMDAFISALNAALTGRVLPGPTSKLRSYRDNVLLASPLTTSFRDLYYRHSPEMLALLRRNPSLIPPLYRLIERFSTSLPEIPTDIESSTIALLQTLRPSMSPALQRDFDATLIQLQNPSIRTALGLSALPTELITRTLTDSSGNTYTIGAIAAQAFLRKTSPTHQLLFERRFGGTGFDIAFGLALGPDNTVYLTGLTQSEDFPTINAAQPRYGGSGPAPLLNGDAFLAVLSTTDGRLIRSTYWGGEGFDIARAIAVDSTGNAYLAGYTESSRFPVSNPLQSFRPTPYAGFLARFDGRTGAVLSSSFLGSASGDAISDIALLPNGDILLVGTRIYRFDSAASRFLLDLPTPPLTSLLPLANNEFIVAGVETNADGPRGFLARYSPTGQVLARLPLSRDNSQFILPANLFLRSGLLEVLGATLTDSLATEPYLARLTPAFTATTAITPVSIPSAPTPGFLTGYDSRGLLTGLPFDPTSPFLTPTPQATPLTLALATTRRSTEELTPGTLFVLSGLSALPNLPPSAAATDSSNPPTELAGIRLRFGADLYAPLHNYTPNEIIFVAPAAAAPATLTLELNGQPLATRPVRWSQSAPQLFTTNGQSDGPLLGEWVDAEDGPSRLSFFAAGLAPDLAATTLYLVNNARILPLELATRTPLAGYLGIDQILTAPLPPATAKPAGARLYLRDAARLSNPARLP